jgi:hypothetical protein
MPVADFIKDVGKGLAAGAKKVGDVAQPVLARTAEVVSGQAPEIDAEQRKRAEKLEDQEIAVKSAALESQLAMGQKYGTLTPEQQQQYVDAISSLYSHPRHAGTLMEKLRKAIHPQGAVYDQSHLASLKNATPPGGTSAVDAERAQELASLKRTQREYASPNGQERNWFVPGEEPQGWNAVAGSPHPSKPMVVRLANGQPGFAYPQPDGSFKDQSGTVVNATPFTKPPAPQIKTGVSQGKNTYAMLTENGWVDAGTKQPLPDFKPNPTFAQTGMFAIDTSYDQNGNPIPVLLDRRSGKVSAAPAGLVAPMMAKGIEAARTGAIGADSRLRQMLGLQQRAKAGDQQAMLAMTANHIGMTLGAQKGARINQAVWNEAVESAPWLARAAAHFGPDGYLSGVVLSPDQVDQMVDLGQLARQAAWENTVQQAAAAGVPMDVPPFEQHPTGAPRGPITGAKKVTNVGGILPKTGAAKPAAPSPQDDPLGIFR